MDIHQVRCLHYRSRCVENPKGMFGNEVFLKPSLDFEELTFYFFAVFLSRVIYKCHQVNRPYYLNIFIRKLQHAKKYPTANWLLGLVVILLLIIKQISFLHVS